jgi:large subunit ribosomal protein L7/L12
VATVNIDEIVETLSKLPVLELARLKTALEEKWGVKAAAAAPAAFAAPIASGAPAAEVQESTEFNVTLEEAPADKRIAIIKVVREVTGLGLKEAKDMVEGAPKPLKNNASKAEAEEIVKKVQTAGGKASMKGL